MLICSYGEQAKEYKNTPCVFLLGGFDGLHAGHSALLAHAREYGLPVGIMSIEGGKGDALFTFAERREIFAAQGVDFVVEIPFTEAFKNTSRERFLDTLSAQFDIKAFVCGKDFRFGKGAAGDPEFIAEYTKRPTHAHDILYADGKKIATATIKEYVRAGEMEKANALLLQPFFLKGNVEEGRKEGRKLGFPTANITYPQGKFPLKEGVYAVHTTIDGSKYLGIANFGACPTFGVEYRKAEAYFDGFNGDLYGKEIDIFFDSYLRDIRKFPSKEALAEQLRHDMQRVRNGKKE